MLFPSLCSFLGKSIASGNGAIRVFIRNTEDNIETMSNEAYDKHIAILSRVVIASLQNRKSKWKSSEVDPACGQCIL